MTIYFVEEKLGTNCLVINHDEHARVSLIFRSEHDYSVVSNLYLRPVINYEPAMSVIGSWENSFGDGLSYDNALKIFKEKVDK